MAARPPPTKKSRREANAPRVTAEERASNFLRTCTLMEEFCFANSVIIVLTAFEST